MQQTLGAHAARPREMGGPRADNRPPGRELERGYWTFWIIAPVSFVATVATLLVLGG